MLMWTVDLQEKNHHCCASEEHLKDQGTITEVTGYSQSLGLVLESFLFREERDQEFPNNVTRALGSPLPSLPHGAHLPVLIGVLHDLPPDPLHGLVALALHRQLPGDVFRSEDGLKVEPGPLAVQPFLQHLLGREGQSMNCEGPGLKLGSVPMTKHFTLSKCWAPEPVSSG
jgi:hypothetical protein